MAKTICNICGEKIDITAQIGRGSHLKRVHGIAPSEVKFNFVEE